MSIKQAIEALLAERNELNEVLARIGDMAHHASTGPAVPDKLWEIRGLAYDHVILETDEPPALAALRSMPAEPVGELDVADIIAGTLPTSRAHAYELMREALKDATPHTEAVRMSEAEILNILCGVDADTKRLPPGFAQFARAVEQAIAARLGVKMGDV